VVKRLMTALLILFGLIVLMAFALGAYSHKTPETGLLAGQLRACPDAPNCVCSESAKPINPINPQHRIDPVAIHTPDRQAAWSQLMAVLTSSGGDIRRHDATYVHATFTSRLFRFVDDLELRLDAENNIIHIRSASRVGHSDFGVNRKRVEQIRNAYDKIFSTGSRKTD